MLSGTWWDPQGVSVQRAQGLQAEPEEQQHQHSPAPAPPAPGKAVHPQPSLHRVGLNSSSNLLPSRGVGTGCGCDTGLMSCRHRAKCQGSFWDQFGSQPVARCSGWRDARQMRSRRRLLP